MVGRAQDLAYNSIRKKQTEDDTEQQTKADTITDDTIKPFELALVILYVHWVDKTEQKKSVNIIDNNLSESRQRFIAALEVVETMLERDDERARRASKDERKSDRNEGSIAALNETAGQVSKSNGTEAQNAAGQKQNMIKMEKKAANVAKFKCKSAQNFHYEFHSGSTNNGFIRCAFFCALIIVCATWMATGPSLETARWQISVSSIVQTELASSYADLTSFLAALAAFSAAWPPDDSFTRSLGNTELRVIRLATTPSSSCSGADNLTCVPTINLYPTLSFHVGMLPPSAYSDAPPSFNVPPFSKSFKFNRNETPFRCGTVYCFDGSGYTFQAADSSEYLAAVKSNVFDSSVRAVIVSFALYSPSLQAALKCSYLAEILPTGNVLVSFDSFVFDYVEAVELDRTVQEFSKMLWGAKILVIVFFLELFESMFLCFAIQVLLCTCFYFIGEFIEFLLEDNLEASEEFNKVSATTLVIQSENADLSRLEYSALNCIFVFLHFLQLAKQKIHLNKQYHDDKSSFREKMGSLVKRVSTESLPTIGRITLVRMQLKISTLLLTTFRQRWFPLFIIYNFMWPIFFVWRLLYQFAREILGRGKKHYYGIERHIYSCVCNHSM